MPNEKCPKSKDWVPGRVIIGKHTLSSESLYARIVDKIPGVQFESIIKKIEKDLDKEHA